VAAISETIDPAHRAMARSWRVGGCRRARISMCAACSAFSIQHAHTLPSSVGCHVTNKQQPATGEPRGNPRRASQVRAPPITSSIVASEQVSSRCQSGGGEGPRSAISDDLRSRSTILESRRTVSNSRNDSSSGHPGLTRGIARGQ
jgi:hypothetical protein